MCHFYQMHGPDRDQSETIEAIAELTTFVTRYSNINPNDPDARRANRSSTMAARGCAKRAIGERRRLPRGATST